MFNLKGSMKQIHLSVQFLDLKTQVHTAVIV